MPCCLSCRARWQLARVCSMIASPRVSLTSRNAERPLSATCRASLAIGREATRHAFAKACNAVASALWSPSSRKIVAASLKNPALSLALRSHFPIRKSALPSEKRRFSSLDRAKASLARDEASEVRRCSRRRCARNSETDSWPWASWLSRSTFTASRPVSIALSAFPSAKLTRKSEIRASASPLLSQVPRLKLRISSASLPADSCSPLTK
mmetsp:Transcript_90856/g.161741  ORF Transcript_90856/g.161741 Transcript_90856/m.161741 type:complete len:210 (+) Transcript_90856:231-860(+)